MAAGGIVSLVADYTLVNAATNYTVLTANLPAGTWDVDVAATIDALGACQITAWLTDGNSISYAATAANVSAAGYLGLALAARVTVSPSTTINLIMRSNLGGSNTVVKAAAPNAPAGAAASVLRYSTTV